jgi:hypothetical protein
MLTEADLALMRHADHDQPYAGPGVEPAVERLQLRRVGAPAGGTPGQ